MSRPELVGHAVTSLLPGLSLDDLSSTVFSPHPPSDRTLTLVAASGTSLPVAARVRPLRVDGGRALVLELRRRAEPPPEQQTLDKLAWAAERSAEAVAITSPKGVIEFVNAAFEAATGYPRFEAIGSTHAILRSGQQETGFYRDLWTTILKGDVYRAVFVNRRKDGSLFHEEKTIRPIMDDAGRIMHFVATGRDVSERIRMIDRLKHAATHDPLSGLPNRTLFMDRLGQAFKRVARRGEGFGLAIVDIDRFKAINDRLGHAAGDSVLQEAASRLRQCVRDTDTVARLGGDEFALILADSSEAADVTKTLEKILAVYAPPIRTESELVQITVSIGACLCGNEDADAQLLMKRADSAMYAAKRAGGNRFQILEEPTIPPDIAAQ